MMPQRSADLVPILAAAPPRTLTLRQGTVIAWNTTTGANTIGVGAAGFTDMPIIGIDLTSITAGDQVMILVDGTTNYVLGKLTKP